MNGMNSIETWQFAVTVIGLVGTCVGATWMFSWQIGSKIDKVRQEGSVRGKEVYAKIDTLDAKLEKKVDRLDDKITENEAATRASIHQLRNTVASNETVHAIQEELS